MSDVELSRRGFLGMLGVGAGALIVPSRLLALPQQFERVPRSSFACALIDERKYVVACKTVPAGVLFQGDLVTFAPEEFDFQGYGDLAVGKLSVYLPAAGKPQFLPLRSSRLVRPGESVSVQIRPFRHPERSADLV